MQIIRSEACDRISLKLGRVGGFSPATQIIAMCDAAGIGVSLDTSPYTLIGDTASCHAAAKIDTPYPIDCDGHVSYLTMCNPSPFLGGVTLEGGRAYVPDKPGLGVEVDWLQIGEPEPWCDRP